MIFAAGLGTRLKPLTDHLPKALVPVMGVPMLERVILKLKDAGFTDLTVNIHHFGDLIVDFLNEKHNFGVNIHISDERKELLDTGGGILKAREFLDGDEPFLVHNVDIFTDLDLKSIYNTHLTQKVDATLLVSERSSDRKLIFASPHNLQSGLQLKGWINKKTNEEKPYNFHFNSGTDLEYSFAGIHILSPSIFQYFDDEWSGKFSIIPFYLSICQRANIVGYPFKGNHWFDIGKIETLQQAEAYIQENLKSCDNFSK